MREVVHVGCWAQAKVVHGGQWAQTAKCTAGLANIDLSLLPVNFSSLTIRLSNSCSACLLSCYYDANKLHNR